MSAPRTTILRRQVLPWVLTITLLAGAWIIALITPPDDAAERIFETTALVGEPANARNLAVTVHDVRATHAITFDGWRAEGTWIVINLDAEATTSQEHGQLDTAILKIGERSFQATERGPIGWSLGHSTLVPGVPQNGSLAFELPADALAGTAELQLSSAADTRYDAIVTLRIPLDALTMHDAINLPAVDWARP